MVERNEQSGAVVNGIYTEERTPQKQWPMGITKHWTCHLKEPRLFMNELLARVKNKQ
jgi:hypothetical protein